MFSRTIFRFFVNDFTDFSKIKSKKLTPVIANIVGENCSNALLFNLSLLSSSSPSQSSSSDYLSSVLSVWSTVEDTKDGHMMVMMTLVVKRRRGRTGFNSERLRTELVADFDKDVVAEGKLAKIEEVNRNV